MFAIYFTANGQRKLIDGSIRTIFPHKERGRKEEQEKNIQAQVFSVNFTEFSRTPFLRTSPVAASEDELDETELLHMTSRLNKCYL